MIKVYETKELLFLYGKNPFFVLSLPDYGSWQSELYEKYRPHIYKCKQKSEWEKLGIKPDDYSVDAISLEKTDGCINFRVISDELASEILQNNNLNLFEKQQIEINEKCITNEITCTIVRNSFEQYTELINGNIYRLTTEYLEEAFAAVKWEIRRIIPFENCRNFYDLAPFKEKPSIILDKYVKNKTAILEIILEGYLENKLEKIKSFKTSNPKKNLAVKTKDEIILFCNESENKFSGVFIEQLLNKINQYL